MGVSIEGFAPGVVDMAWGFAEHKCHCRAVTHDHANHRCNNRLAWDKRGQAGPGSWEAYPMDGTPSNNSLANCHIICWECTRNS